jgi:hypothetical protein
MKKCCSAVRTRLCVLSHLTLCFVPRLCVLSHLALCFVSLTLCFVPLLGKNIRNVCIRKMKSVRKSLSKPDDLRSQVGANFSLAGIHTLAACECREVVV